MTTYKDKDEILGNLNFALPFFDSEIFFLIGSPNNTIHSDKKLLIWTDRNSSILSSIEFKEEIIDVQYAKNCFLIVLKNKILLFHLLNLNLICTIEDYKYDKLKITHSISSSDTINLFNISNLNPNHVKINKFFFEKKTGLFSRYQRNLVVKEFKKISHIETDFLGEYIAIANETGNKIKIYSSDDYVCLFKFYRGNSRAEIKKICFDSNNKYMALISDRKTIHFFKLSKKFGTKYYVSENSNKNIKNENKNTFISSTTNDMSDEEQESGFFNDLLSDIKVCIYFK